MGKKTKTKTKPVRRSSRVVKNKITKEATDFLECIVSMQEKLQQNNIEVISKKQDLAVTPLNDINFLSIDYNIILPKPTTSGIFETKVSKLIDILNWTDKDKGAIYPGVLLPPVSTLGIRKPFDDFNDVIKKDQAIKGHAKTLVSNTSDICKLSKGKTASIESYRKEKREIQRNYQHMCFYCGKQMKVKNPLDTYPELLNTQCDHIFPIASALISLRRDSNILYNFQAVHKSCNSKATSMTIDEIWKTIGTPTFTSLNPSLPWCNFNLDGILTSTGTNTQDWCRGYLSILLNKLTIVSTNEQLIRKQIFEKVIQSYAEYKEEVKLLMQDDVTEGVKYLAMLATKGTQSFGNPENNIKLVSVKKLNGEKKKYEATFLVNGKEKKEKFGAEGMSDYTIHRDIERRNRYISRHYKDLNTKDPTRAGYLSMFILWDKPSLRDSIKQYKTRLSIYNKTGKFPIGIKGYNKNNFGTPSNVVDKNLYEKIKEKIHEDIKGRRWGAYDSGRLVKMYKEAGGKYSGSKKDTPLSRWYKEKWVNACKWPKVVPCGRSDMTNKMAYCRPSVKVTKDTPVLVQNLTEQQINKRCKIKQEYPLVRISGKVKA